MKRIVVSAPGKLHLLGEHAVVWGKPAIIVAANKRCFIEITPRKDQKIKIISKNYKKEIVTSFKDIVIKFQKAQTEWEVYNKNNDITLLKSITKNPLDYPLIIIGEFLSYYQFENIDGFSLTIDSEIPVGSGMGSSAALSVSMVGALSLSINKKFDKKEINKIAFLCEQKKHGLPSGGDNTTSCFGGLIWFKKGKGIKLLDVALSKKIIKYFYVVNTGIPSETTGEMVSLVKTLYQKQPKFVEKILNDQEKLVKNLLAALEKGKHNEIIRIIRSGEHNLESLGVVSSYVQKIIRAIESSGGAAKINGGGGTKKGTGMLLIYHQDFKSLKKVLNSHQLEVERIILGVEGLRKE